MPASCADADKSSERRLQAVAGRARGQKQRKGRLSLPCLPLLHLTPPLVTHSHIGLTR